MTDSLIERLTADLRPARRGYVAARLGAALALGGMVAAAVVVAGMGLRPDLPEALASAMFWVKLAYTGALAATGVAVAEQLSRPDGEARRRAAWLLAPLAALVGLAVFQLLSAPAGARSGLVVGASAAVCPWCICAVSAPVFAALVWAVRGLAPTRLRAAGGIVGLTAGGAGAAAYALHCPEAGAPFVAIWYSAGILAVGGLGAVLGPRLLRW